LLGPATNTVRPFFDQLYQIALEVGWSIQNPSRRLPGLFASGSNVRFSASVGVTPKTIRNYCHTCESIEPYNFVQGADILYDINEDDQSVQVFALSLSVKDVKEGLKFSCSKR